MNNFIKVIGDLNLEGIIVGAVQDSDKYSCITIQGGLNGDFHNWNVYLWQIQGIVLALNADIIDLVYDTLGEVWTLRIKVYK